MNPYFPTKKYPPHAAPPGSSDAAPCQSASLRGHNSTEISLSDLPTTPKQMASGKAMKEGDNENTATTFSEISATEFELSVPTNQDTGEDIWEHSSLSQGSFPDHWEDSIQLGNSPAASPPRSKFIFARPKQLPARRHSDETTLSPLKSAERDSDETTLSPINVPRKSSDMMGRVVSCVDFSAINNDSAVPGYPNRWSDGGVQLSKSFQKMILARRRPSNRDLTGDGAKEDQDDSSSSSNSSSDSDSSESTKSNDERKPSGRRALLRRLSSSDSLLAMPSTSLRARQITDKPRRGGKRPVGRNYSFMKSESAREGPSDRRTGGSRTSSVRVKEFIELAQEDRRRKFKGRRDSKGSTK